MHVRGTFAVGTAWRRRLAALVGVAALAVPLWPGAVVAPPAAESAVPAPGLEWKDVRPPMTDDADTTDTDGFRHLPDFGGVRHALAVAPNGDLFAAGTGADVDSDQDGTCTSLVDASQTGGGACFNAAIVTPAIFKSTDGGMKWRSAPVWGASTLAGATVGLGTSIQKIAVSPKYPTDNFVMVLFSLAAAGANTNGVAFSIDGGATFPSAATTGATAGATTFATVLLKSIALSPDFSWADGNGSIAFGGTSATANNLTQASTSVWKAASAANRGTTGGGLGALTPVTMTADDFNTATDGIIDVSFTDGVGTMALAALYVDSGVGTCAAVVAANTLPDCAAGTAIVVASFATLGKVAFDDSYTLGGVFFAAFTDAAAFGGVFRFTGSAWERKTPFSGNCSGGVSDLAISGNGATTRMVAGLLGSNQACRTTNEGSTWSAAEADVGDSVCDQCKINTVGAQPTVAANRATPNVVYWATSTVSTATRAGGGVARSTDTGSSWADTGLINEPANVNTSPRPVNDQVVFANVRMNNSSGCTGSGTCNRHLFLTENFGASAGWKRVLRYGGADVSLAPIPGSFTTDNTLYIRRTNSTADNLLKSNDGGRTWRKTAADPLANSPDAFELLSADSTRSGSVVFIGGSKGHVAASTDGGSSWTLLAKDFGTGLDEFDFIDNARTMYIVTAQDTDNLRKLWWTGDSGATFTQIGDATTAWGTGNPATVPFSTLISGVDKTTGKGTVLVVAANSGTGTISNTDLYRYDLSAASATWVDGGTDQNWTSNTEIATPGVGDGFTLVLWRTGELVRTATPLSTNSTDWTNQRQKMQTERSANAADFTTCQNADGAPCLLTPGAGRYMVMTLPADFQAGPALTAPAAGSTLATNVGNDGVPAVFRWSAIGRAACYDLQMSLDNDFRAPALDGAAVPFGAGSCGFGAGVSTGASYQVTSAVFALASSQTYWWRVRVRASDASVDNTSGNQASVSPWSTVNTFTVVPADTSFLSLSVTSGNPGASVTATGSLFTPTETVQVQWDTPAALLAAPVTDARGAFSVSVTIPAGSPVGLHLLRAQGTSSGRLAAASFLVTAPGAPAPSFQGKVKIGVPGGGEAAPPAGYQVQVFVHNTGVVTPLNTQLVQTDGGGVFAVTVSGLAAASYDVRVKGSHTISRKLTGAALPQAGGATPLDFGTLPTGDLSGDDAILGVDYSAMVSNFGLTGPLAVSGGLAAFRGGDDAPVRVRLASEAGAIETGATFRVDVVVESGRPIDAMDVLLRYAPDRLVLVDTAGDATSAVTPGAGLPMVLRNAADGGTVWFSAGQSLPGHPAQGTFTLFSVGFKALTAIQGDSLPLRLDYASPEATAAYYRGARLPQG